MVDQAPLSLDAVLADGSLPEAVLRHLRAGAALDDIRLDGRGRWWHNGAPITHPRLATLFSRSIDRTPGGTWVLRVGAMTYPIRVDACPLFVEQFSVEGGRLWVHLSDGQRREVPLCALYAPPSGGLHVALDAHLHARWSPSAYMRFVEAHILDHPDGSFGVAVGDQQRALRDTPDC